MESRLKEYTGGMGHQAGRDQLDLASWEEAGKKAQKTPWTEEEAKAHHGCDMIHPAMLRVKDSIQNGLMGSLGTCLEQHAGAK